jgi:hypothetical protein
MPMNTFPASRRRHAAVTFALAALIVVGFGFAAGCVPNAVPKAPPAEPDAVLFERGAPKDDAPSSKSPEKSTNIPPEIDTASKPKSTPEVDAGKSKTTPEVDMGSGLRTTPEIDTGSVPSLKPPPPDWLERFELVHRTIKPGKDEWRFASLPWASTVAEAREQAAADGKPLFIWYMVGEPLGQC